MRADIKALARSLRDEYGSRDPFLIAARLGIQTIHCKLPVSIRGFYQTLFDVPLIYINDTLEEDQRPATCAHELGHALLHPSLNTLYIRANTDLLVGKYEREAELFAVYLLYDDPFPAGC